MPGFLVRRAHQRHNTIFSQETQGRDITAPQFGALRALAEFPGIDQTTLSRLIAFDRPTIGGLVDRLETKGLILRTLDEHDRRANSLRLTPRGRLLLEELRPMMVRVSERLLEPLSSSEQKQFLDLLERVIGYDANAQEGSDEDARVPHRSRG